MKVLKFGGSSISTKGSCLHIVDILHKEIQKTDQIWCVFSAFSGVTDELESIARQALGSKDHAFSHLNALKNKHIQICREWLSPGKQSQIIPEVLALTNNLEEVVQGIWLLKECSPKTLDFVRSFGERLSTFILTAFLSEHGFTPLYVDARDVIVTDNFFEQATVDMAASYKNVHRLKEQGTQLVCLTGYIGRTSQGETTTLGRNGSDYSAAVLAALTEAEELQIWTDVDGVLTADPERVRKAFTIPHLSYNEAMELSHFGAKVLHARTMQPVISLGIPILIKNTFFPEKQGTCIQSSSNGKHVVKGLSSLEKIALINMSGAGMTGVCGIAGRMFSALADANVNIILISQASSEHTICIAIKEQDIEKAASVIQNEFLYEMEKGLVDKLEVKGNKAIVAVVGEKMRHTPGISGKLFQSLGKNGINVEAIAQGSSEWNISVVIDEKDLNKALNTIHDAFFLSDYKTFYLFLIGPGLIGSLVLDLLKNQKEYLASQLNMEFVLAGIINTRKQLIKSEGIPLDQWKRLFEEQGEKASLDQFLKNIFQLNLPNAIVLDCTSSDEVMSYYPKILTRNIALVTPNKKANSGEFENYRRLHELSSKRNIPFLYETNVGAGLPVIQTIRNLIIGGDKIVQIEGILSGTLNFIFSEFMQSDCLFSEIVKMAFEKGYTEPHPEDDLNGQDVGRKILILSREAGYKLELADVEIHSVIPPQMCGHLPLTEFFQQLKHLDAKFLQLRKKAKQQRKRLRFIAKFENNRAKAQLMEIGENHPFYRIDGSDNIVALYSLHYKERPLIVQGAGAGAQVTASGVVADIIKAAHLVG